MLALVNLPENQTKNFPRNPENFYMNPFRNPTQEPSCEPTQQFSWEQLLMLALEKFLN